MRLRKIEIDNFKSLVNFEMELEKFNCIVGLNGAGKSTLLQSLDFISHQMKGDISSWLRRRGWQAKELHSKLTKAKNISVAVTLEIDDSNYKWEFDFNTSLLRCTAESLSVNEEKVLRVENAKYSIDGKSYIAMQEYEGSILSSLKEEKLPDELKKIKNFIKNITSLDLLSPQSMRLRSRNDGVDLGLSGEYLASFLNQLDNTKKKF